MPERSDMDYQRMSKCDLLREIKRIEKKIGEATDEKRLQRYQKRYKLARRHFYECKLCADAKIELYIDKNGDERERLIKDCGLSVCPYHNYFEDLANGIEDATTKVIDRLHRCLGEG